MATEGGTIGADPSRPFEAVVLAAGAGARFGGGKLLAPYMAGVLLDGALACAFAAPARSVTVVTGAEEAAVAQAAIRLADRLGLHDRLRMVHAADYALGMAHSLRMGIAGLPTETAGAFVFLGDMPRVPRDILAPMAEAVRGGAEAAAPVFQGRRGNPVLLSAALFPEMLALSGDRGARAILDGLGDRLALVEAPDDGVLYDVDRREDIPSAAHPGESRDPS
ncbi:NTP transferase domain-containing protein [Phenylobacterium sp. J367]|uniref:nucleotidyltransferase family protein n=1 Tax=Phenylobacterium sp. J367 TaxID=2898435 RepID=UPI002150ED96|nr:NTP transferase domain-containing protein [Phenylobacterium sp. J367]MCR5877810.1 NTP transferase domain-containing protein [Phenylobacterium sp. J367]